MCAKAPHTCVTCGSVEGHDDEDVFYNNCGNDDAFQFAKMFKGMTCVIHINALCMKCKHTKCCSRREQRLGAGKCLKNH